MERFIYPLISAHENTVEKDGKISTYISLFTSVRKLHTDGKWYFIRIRSNGNFDNQVPPAFYEKFYLDVYMNLILCIIIPEGINTGAGTIEFPLDPDQTPEDERLRKLIP